MPSLKMIWMPRCLEEFEKVRSRAKADGKLDIFLHWHNEVVDALTDVAKAIAVGEMLRRTIKPGGQTLHWIHGPISVWYTVFPDSGSGWVTTYETIPSTWPY